jgi:3-hydroxy-3-methylglutaryl CoA synthase
MAEYAASRVWLQMWLANPGARAELSAGLDLPADLRDSSPEKRKELERAFRGTSAFRRAFAEKVAPSLVLPQEIGNIYSGSMYLAFASLLEESREETLTGRRVVFGSYGSGASAKVLSGVIQSEYASIAKQLGLRDQLRPEHEGGERIAISLRDYERLHRSRDVDVKLEEAIVAKLRDGVSLSAGELQRVAAVLERPSWRPAGRPTSVRPPRGEFALVRLGNTSSDERVDVGYRYYDWVGA